MGGTWSSSSKCTILGMPADLGEKDLAFLVRSLGIPVEDRIAGSRTTRTARLCQVLQLRINSVYDRLQRIREAVCGRRSTGLEQANWLAATLGLRPFEQGLSNESEQEFRSALCAQMDRRGLDAYYELRAFLIDPQRSKASGGAGFPHLRFLLDVNDKLLRLNELSVDKSGRQRSGSRTPGRSPSPGRNPSSSRTRRPGSLGARARSLSLPRESGSIHPSRGSRKVTSLSPKSGTRGASMSQSTRASVTGLPPRTASFSRSTSRSRSRSGASEASPGSVQPSYFAGPGSFTVPVDVWRALDRPRYPRIRGSLGDTSGLQDYTGTRLGARLRGQFDLVAEPIPRRPGSVRAGAGTPEQTDNPLDVRLRGRVDLVAEPIPLA